MPTNTPNTIWVRFEIPSLLDAVKSKAIIEHTEPTRLKLSNDKLLNLIHTLPFIFENS